MEKMSEAEPALEVSYEEKKQVRNPWVPAASSDNVGNESDDSVTSPAPISKPPGKDKQKKAKRKEMQGLTGVKLSSATQQEVALSLRLMAKQNAIVAKERNCRHKERAKQIQEEVDDKNMQKNTLDYTPMSKAYFDRKKRKIIAPMSKAYFDRKKREIMTRRQLFTGGFEI